MANECTGAMSPAPILLGALRATNESVIRLNNIVGSICEILNIDISWPPDAPKSLTTDHKTNLIADRVEYLTTICGKLEFLGDTLNRIEAVLKEI